MDDLPDVAAQLLATARAAHYSGDRELEKSASDKLMMLFGIRVTFPCCDSVESELAVTRKGGDRA